MELRQVEKISKALSDLTRLKILEKIGKCDGSFQCADIKQMTQLAQPSVSHHIKTLIEADLILFKKDGRNHSYILNKPLIKNFLGAIRELTVKHKPVNQTPISIK